MSNQNKFLLNKSSSSTTKTTASSSNAGSGGANGNNNKSRAPSQMDSQLSLDSEFDAYWDEEHLNPYRNRIRIGRQYQATVPQLLKTDEQDPRTLQDLETLSFCPKESAKVSDAELDHYFTIAKSLNLFASLVETRSLLGRDVTIADLNHIRHKEGLSLSSVIQPTRQSSGSSAHMVTSPVSSQNNPGNAVSSNSIQKSPPILSGNNESQRRSLSPLVSSSPTDCAGSTINAANNCSDTSTGNNNNGTNKNSNTDNNQMTLNQPLMRALSHFISLHHPCHHDGDCRKLNKDIPLEDESSPVVSITAGNLRQGAGQKLVRQRGSLSKQPQQLTTSSDRDSDDPTQQLHVTSDNNTIQASSYDDWTREDVDLFSRAIEVCGKNFSSIKKEFLPSKSVRSIVEYYYIGSRDVSDNKRKSNQSIEANIDGCSSAEKSSVNNNSSQGGGGGGGSGGVGGNSASTSSYNGKVVNTDKDSPIASSATADNTNDVAATDASSTGYSSAAILGDSSTLAGGDTQTQRSGHFSRLRPNELSSNQVSKQVAMNNKSDQNGAEIKCEINSTNIDTRMSVYNFDDELNNNEDNKSPIKVECPQPGAEVKPLKARPIVPGMMSESEASNSNLGSLKFFMDGQLVLKLNACQEQQKGGDKCHWVQSGDRIAANQNRERQKRYSKRASTEGNSLNGGSPFADDDSSKNEPFTCDEDSKESGNSLLSQPSNKKASTGCSQQSSGSPNSKRLRNIRSEPSTPPNQCQGQSPQPQQPQQQLPSPINYNRLAMNNLMRERGHESNLNVNNGVSGFETSNPMLANLQLPANGFPNMGQVPNSQTNGAAAAASQLMSQAMPWLPPNSLAMAAALLGGFQFGGAPQVSQSMQVPSANHILQAGLQTSPLPIANNMNPSNTGMVFGSKPMDLSLEQGMPQTGSALSPPVTSQKQTHKSSSSSRSRSKTKNTG